LYQDLVDQLHTGRRSKVKWVRFTAVINCLSPQETCHCIFEMLATEPDDYMSDKYIRDAFIQKLVIDISSNGWQQCHETLSRQLLGTFENLESYQQRRHGLVLSGLAGVPVIPEKQKQTIIYLLLNSEHVRLRESACKVLRENWATNYIDEIEQTWIRYQDKSCAQVIVRHCPIEIQERQFTRLWALDDGWITITLFMNVDLTTKRLAKLRKLDGITYAYICAKRKVILSDKEATELWDKHGKDKKAGLLLWSFGQMKLKDFLVNLQLGTPKKRTAHATATKEALGQLPDVIPA